MDVGPSSSSSGSSSCLRSSPSHKRFNEPQEVLPKAGHWWEMQEEAAPLPWNSAQPLLVPTHPSCPFLKCEQTQTKSRYQVS